MSDYIRRDEALLSVENSVIDQCEMYYLKDKAEGFYKHVQDGIYEISSANVAPIRHGKWSKENIIACGGFVREYYECSICFGRNICRSKYCPNCGAKMDEQELSISGTEIHLKSHMIFRVLSLSNCRRPKMLNDAIKELKKIRRFSPFFLNKKLDSIIEILEQHDSENGVYGNYCMLWTPEDDFYAVETPAEGFCYNGKRKDEEGRP